MTGQRLRIDAMQFHNNMSRQTFENHLFLISGFREAPSLSQRPLPLAWPRSHLAALVCHRISGGSLWSKSVEEVCGRSMWRNYVVEFCGGILWRLIKGLKA